MHELLLSVSSTSMHELLLSVSATRNTKQEFIH
jgi:hypothetical protein